MSFVKEFKDFAVKGNLIDLAVGFVMGAAFTKVTSAFIQGMVMPLVGLVQGKDMSEWVVVLKDAKFDEQGSEISAQVTIKYGAFIGVTLEFVIVAFFMFLLVKGINQLKRKKAEEPAPEPTPVEPSKQEVLLTEIRDLLRK
ncbi:MAG: large-conductance mechanosensitive channel protein MscL [Luteibaculaceae bacterium]